MKTLLCVIFSLWAIAWILTIIFKHLTMFYEQEAIKRSIEQNEELVSKYFPIQEDDTEGF